MDLVSKANVLSEIHKQCFDKYWTEEEFETLLESKYNKVIVACTGDCEHGDIKGFVLYQQVDERECEILTICVLPEHRNQGIAKHLIKKIKADRIFLEVSEDNLIAVSLYEALGFKTKSVRRKYYADGSNALTMEKFDFSDWVEE